MDKKEQFQTLIRSLHEEETALTIRKYEASRLSHELQLEVVTSVFSDTPVLSARAISVITPKDDTEKALETCRVLESTGNIPDLILADENLHRITLYRHNDGKADKLASPGHEDAHSDLDEANQTIEALKAENEKLRFLRDQRPMVIDPVTGAYKYMEGEFMPEALDLLKDMAALCSSRRCELTKKYGERYADLLEKIQHGPVQTIPRQ